MVASSQVLRSARRGCQKGPVAPSAREDAVDCVAAPSDDGFDIGYITYLLVDYEMHVRYRLAMLRIMREQSCDACASKAAMTAKTPKARTRAARPGCINCLFSACFALFLPASRAASTGAGMRAFPVCFLELTGRSQAPGCAGGPVSSLLFTGGERRDALFQFEPERVGLIGDLAATDRIDRRHHAAVAAEHAVGKRHEAAVGRRRRRGAAKLARDRPFVATRVERAGRDIGARGRAADAGIAMQHQRPDAVPAVHERDQGGDV